MVCRDRKGLVYDLMRTMKDIEVRPGLCNRLPEQADDLGKTGV